jgi:hypothetical protein
VGTLWGQRLLVDYFNAIHARLGDDPEQFYLIKSYKDKAATTGFDDYYTTVHPGASSGGVGTWSQRMTIGKRFTHTGHPSPDLRIMFVRFSTIDGLEVARCPLSVAALLEAGAVYEETNAAKRLAFEMKNSGRPLSAPESAEIRKNLDLFYEPKLMKYSAAAHLVARETGRLNSIDALSIAATISALSLNLPSEYYSKLSFVEGRFAEEPNSDEAKRARADYELLKAEKYPAVAFRTLLYYLAPGFRTDLTLPERLLSNAGLPSLVEIEQACRDEMRMLPDNLHGGEFFEYATKLLSLGGEIFEERGVLGLELSPLDALRNQRLLPPIFLADGGSMFQRAGDPLLASLARRVDVLKKGIGDRPGVLEQMAEFCSVCGV